MEAELSPAYKEVMCKRLAFESPKSHLIPACGCYIRDVDIIRYFKAPVAVPLKHIDYSVDIYDNIAAIKLEQDYTNPLEGPLELEYSFPVNPAICLYRFQAKFNDIQLFGVVEEKEVAKRKYQEGLKEGKQVAYAAVDERSKDIVNMKIGNVPGGANVKITIEFLQMLDVSLNTFWQLLIPSTISPRYMNDKAPPASFPELAKLAETVNTELPKYTWTFKIVLRTSPNKKIVQCQSKSHSLLQLSMNETNTETTFVMQESCRPNKDFYFSFATENFNEPTAVLGRTDTSVSAAVSFIPKFCDLTINDAVRMQLEGKDFECDIESAKGEYLFLLDRSGSMGKDRMDKAKEALSFFLRSLPQDIYFNIYSFGDRHRLLFEESMPYTKDFLNSALKQIGKMKSDMGGTNIQTPLQAILKRPLKKGYPRQVFVLTDGGVNNTERVIQMVKENIKYSRVHTIGVGNGASEALIQGCAEKGKGKYVFIQDNENVSGKIIELLSAAMSPVITKFVVDFDDKVVETINPNPKSMPYILKNEPVCLFVAFKPGFEGQTKLTLRYEDSLNKLPYEKSITINSAADTSFAVVDKMVHHKALTVLCEKLHDEKGLAEDIYLPPVKDLRSFIVDSSVKNQVLCELTAFVCVGKAVGDAEGEKMKVQSSTRVTVPQTQPRQYEERSYGASRGGRGGAILMKKCKMSSPMSSVTLSSASTPALKPSAVVARSSNQPTTDMNHMRRSRGMHLQKEMKCEQKARKRSSKVIRNQSDEECEMEDECAVNEEWEMMPESKEFVKEKQMLPKKESATRSKAEKEIKQPTAGTKIGKDLEKLLDQQQTNGSWLNQPATRAVFLELSRIKETEIKSLESAYKNMDFVLTYMIVVWLESHYNLPEYQLILKKAKAWLSKQSKEAMVSEEDLDKITKLVKVL